jgi:hypothetical protein
VERSYAELHTERSQPRWVIPKSAICLAKENGPLGPGHLEGEAAADDRLIYRPLWRSMCTMTSRDVRYSSAYDAEADSPLISADFRNDPLPTIAKRSHCGALFGDSAVTIEN